MRVAAIAVACLLSVPACVTESPQPRPAEAPDAAPIGDCGLPLLRVRGDVQLTLTRTAVGEGCPYVYDRTLWNFVGADDGIDTTDSPVEVVSSHVEASFEETLATIQLTDEWGVGATSDELTNIRAPVAFDLIFDSTGAITGTATATIPWQDATCVVGYAAAGTFTPVFE